MDTKKLRQKILDLAIRGKLVPQDPNDEPASVLLERIRAEKEQLIKKGKIKRSKKSAASDTSHYENVPFEVPESWCWTTLGEIGNWQAGATPSRMRKDYYGGNIPWLKTGDLTDGYIYEIPETITDKALEETSVKLNPTGSVLIAMYGATIGKIGILTFPATTNQACCACVDYKAVTPKYLFNFLLSHKEEFVKMGGGGAQPNISKEKIISTLIPIPPIAEQNRIADEIERLITYIEAIELNQGRLDQSLKLCKERILDMALSGKLISQDQDDEPAIELLRKINPSFTPADNRHYRNVPKGWAVCTFGDILEYEQPQQYIVNSTDYSDEYEIPVLTAGKSFIIGKTNEKLGICKHLPVIIFDDFTTDSKYVDFPFKVKSSAMKILHAKGNVNPKYVAYLMYVTRLVGDTHKRYWISEYSKIPIMLPPVNEQERIVSLIEKIYDRLDKILAEL